MAVKNLQIPLKEAAERIAATNNPEVVLASSLSQPMRGSNSGSRELMYGIHNKQKMNLVKGEAPVISTANENEFLKWSSNYKTTDCDKMVIGKVDKFVNIPNLHYWLIMMNTSGPNAGDLDVIEAVDYVHTTESYGFRMNKSRLDGLTLGSTINKGFIEKIPNNVDEYGNVQFGLNLPTAYTSNLFTQEDGYTISDWAALMAGSELYPRPTIPLNDNDIMLNIYGEGDDYKVMPDIGEDIKNGTLLAIRRQNNSDAMYSQTWDMLKTIIPSIDKRYSLTGTVIDIDIFSNNYDQLASGPNSQYHTQINYYLQNKYRYCGAIVQYVDEYMAVHPKAKMSIRLQELYKHAYETINHYDHMKNYKKYSGTIIRLVVRQKLPMKQGDKFTNRYGGKGVIAKILPSYLMPKVNGETIHVLMNKATVGGRSNYGQTLEVELNFRSRNFLNHIFMLPLTTRERFDMICDYIELVSPNYAKFVRAKAASTDDSEMDMLMDSFTEEGVIRIPIRPLSDQILLDTLMKIDEAYPWIKQDYIEAPIINSNGKLRYVKSFRPIVVGLEWFFRLKQYAREKFTVTSISTVNLRNENSKSKASKLYEAPYPNTPIKFGFMEIEEINHASSSIAIMMLMLYSSSSQARNGLVNLYFNDPIDINIELDPYSKSRSAEIFNVYFKQIGDRLVFKKRLKNATPVPWKINITREPDWKIKGYKKDVEPCWFIRKKEVEPVEVPWSINL